MAQPRCPEHKAALFRGLVIAESRFVHHIAVSFAVDKIGRIPSCRAGLWHQINIAKLKSAEAESMLKASAPLSEKQRLPL